jgi:perosamine synthetase
MIPVFEPIIEQEEIDLVVSALKRGEISGSFGTAIPEFEKNFAAYVGCKHGIAVNTGTAALHLATYALGLTKGDEVLVSASTNIASALAVHHVGATTVPVDSEPETWNLDLNLMEKLITPRTKAIIAVHLLGYPVDMDALMALADEHGLIVIEDAAEAHGSDVRGKRIGSFGTASCFSFYANKIITTGEGGMITTNDDKLADRLRSLRNLAFTKPRFLHYDAGFNYRMTGMQASLGSAQLSKIDRFIQAKKQLAKNYDRHIKQRIPFLSLQVDNDWANNVYWMYGVKVTNESQVDRNALMLHLQENGIETRTFFCPMSQQPCLKDTMIKTPTPVADNLWETGFYLPSSCSLSTEQVEFICDVIASYQQ